MKILLVDDEKGVRDLLRVILEREGHIVADAENGQNGVVLQRSFRADVLICDVIMPVQEGIETISQFLEEFPSVVIIAISGGGKIDPDSYLTIAKQLGAWKVFKKPVDHIEMLKAINSLVCNINIDSNGDLC